MRKSMIAFLILLVAAAAILTVGVGAVSSGQDQIVVTQTTVMGDLTAAEGLQVRTVLNERRQMFWFTEFEATAPEQAETEFRYYQNRRDDWREPMSLHADFVTPGINFGISGSVAFDMEQDFGFRYDMLLPAEDVASRTPVGGTRTEIVPLQDYYEYYPVRLETNWLDQWIHDDFQKVQDAKFAAYFSIPVPADLKVEITVSKDDAGNVVEIHSEEALPLETPEGYAYRYTSAYTVATEEAVYILLYGNQDYSRLRDGFGLYRIPVTQVDSWEGKVFELPIQALDMDRIENIFPLDPAQGCRLEHGMDDTELLLFEETETGTLLHVLDTEPCRVRQTLELGENTGNAVWFHEDLLIIGDRNHGGTYDSANRLWVFQKNGGQYEKWLETDCYPLNDEGSYYQNLTFAFDGRKFAMADFQQINQGGSHRIAVYDQTGLCYVGDYHYNSDDMSVCLNNFDWEDPLQIQWKS